MKPNYYAILSAEVRYSDITPNAKLLYAEITAFCNMNGECFASNRYFSELYGKSKVTISNWIRELKENGFIETSYTYKEGSKEIDKRYIKILKGGVKENLITPIKKTLKNNTINNNNTSNNNIPIHIRAIEFANEVHKNIGYSKDMLREFVIYWSEKTRSKSNPKLRFELQKTFSISLRLKRWEKNQTEWNKGTSKIDSQLNEYLKGKELL